jgi:hypothetical protein
MAYDAAPALDPPIRRPPSPVAAAELLAGPGGTAAVFDMRTAAGRAGAGRMLMRLGRPVPARETAAKAEEQDRRRLALRRAQARIGLRLLAGEEWAREIAAELVRMDAEAGR